MANGIISNFRGDVIVVVDLGLSRLQFERPLKLAGKDDLPHFESLGWAPTTYPADNIEVLSDNATHLCLALSVIQRVYEVGVVLPANRFASSSTGAAQICCPYVSEAAGRSIDVQGCAEEILFLSDGASGRVHSGVSVAVVLDAEWAGRDEKRLVLTGSWYDKGISACWV